MRRRARAAATFGRVVRPLRGALLSGQLSTGKGNCCLAVHLVPLRTTVTVPAFAGAGGCVLDRRHANTVCWGGYRIDGKGSFPSRGRNGFEVIRNPRLFVSMDSI